MSELAWIGGLLLGVFIIVFERLTGIKIFLKAVTLVALVGALVAEGPMWGRVMLALVAIGAMVADVEGVEV